MNGAGSRTVTTVDLLVFGPHPDDLEIGLGGTIARHVDLGARVGLCDLTAGEMGSNGTVEERLAEAEAARGVLGAAWRINLGWPDRAIGGAEQVLAATRLIREARPRTVALPYWSDRHPDHVAASQTLSAARTRRTDSRASASCSRRVRRCPWATWKRSCATTTTIPTACVGTRTRWIHPRRGSLR